MELHIFFSFFHGNHFIPCTQSGLLSAANIFLIKAVLIGWALAGGRKARLTTEKSDKWTTNTLQFKEGCCHQGQREAGGDALSQWVCYTSAVWCCQGNMLGFKHSSGSQQGPEKWFTARILNCSASVIRSCLWRTKILNATKDHSNAEFDLNNIYTIFPPQSLLKYIRCDDIIYPCALVNFALQQRGEPHAPFDLDKAHAHLSFPQNKRQCTNENSTPTVPH